jgi:hypothetical protein
MLSIIAARTARLGTVGGVGNPLFSTWIDRYSALAEREGLRRALKPDQSDKR